MRGRLPGNPLLLPAAPLGSVTDCYFPRSLSYPSTTNKQILCFEKYSRALAMAIPTATHHDIIIIGAGIQGLCAAHTFLSIQPTLSLLILDEKRTIGGVWAHQQLYPGLRANNLQGYYEFTDLPMLEAGLAGLGVSPRSTLRGRRFVRMCRSMRKGLIW